MPITKAKNAVLQNQKSSTHSHAYESSYEDILPDITKEDMQVKQDID